MEKIKNETGRISEFKYVWSRFFLRQSYEDYIFRSSININCSCLLDEYIELSEDYFSIIKNLAPNQLI